ncbi:hypothetical protein GCM10009851_13980 [Herbiconiux moechotypicola]|uniref:Uncharacterized protein n=1 Tax=Herbiconiux moechotypicola TaxID=637393 RepID=A0ABP5QAH9_9MICO
MRVLATAATVLLVVAAGYFLALAAASLIGVFVALAALAGSV